MVSPKQFWADRNVVPITGDILTKRGTVPIHHIYPYRYVYTVLIYIFIHIYTYINQEPINYSPQIISDGIAANIYPVVHFVRQANALTTAMNTLCMAFAVFAGWVADVQLGRFMLLVRCGAKIPKPLGGLSDDETPLDSLVSHHFSHSKMAKNGSSSRKAPLSHGKYWAISPGL